MKQLGLHHEILSAANYLAVLIGLATINIQIEKNVSYCTKTSTGPGLSADTACKLPV